MFVQTISIRRMVLYRSVRSYELNFRWFKFGFWFIHIIVHKIDTQYRYTMQKKISLDPNKLVPHPQNPRKNEEAIEPVMKSLDEYGFIAPIICDENHTILAGHTRREAAIKLGMKKVPCIKVSGLTSEQKLGYLLADNKTGEFASYNNNLLGTILKELDDKDYNMGSTGFNDEEIEALMSASELNVDDILGLDDLNDSFEDKIDDVELLDQDEDETPAKKYTLKFLCTEAQKEIIQTRLLELKETIEHQVSNAELLTIICSR